ncbi:hypothetical protein LTR70_001619 [Exophiala xenobiotica]|uniref:Uncharacterized protein n=1 Tax=Lithohypha guttulata TaxID=1690604 RepID=A0ABR0K6U3_9EURO|nr:hypothetical protein LTR24_006139 [Lithohypha guttulata]KAK5327145.1 hypothetical protein LTR70_001619 [Exophiala xenobiotica]
MTPTTTQQPETSPDKAKGVLVAILDDYTTPALSATAFQKLLHDSSNQTIPNLTYDIHPSTLNTRTPAGLSAATERLRPYEVICTMRERTPFPADLLNALPNLKLLLTTGMRNASIDLAAARDAGVIVAGTKGSAKIPGFDPTNEQTWALILGVCKGIAGDDARVKSGEGRWQDGVNIGLAGKTLGVLGLGRLGLQCAVTGKMGFGMDVLAWSENLTQEKADEAGKSRGLDAGAIRVAGSKEEFFRGADVVSVHYVLSERSRGIVGGAELGWMKGSAVLVNTSRGPLVEEGALVEALREGSIAGVGLDVFEVEPLPKDSVWRDRAWGRRVVLSPHMGYVEESTMKAWYEQQADSVRRYLTGEELTVVMT